jgi:hypothetical protein
MVLDLRPHCTQSNEINGPRIERVCDFLLNIIALVGFLTGKRVKSLKILSGILN